MHDFAKKTIKIKGTNIQTFLIKLPHNNLILAVAPKGYIMCGYLDIDTAEKLSAAACLVRQVKTIAELLAKPIAELTTAAKKLGISINMTGKKALECLS